MCFLWSSSARNEYISQILSLNAQGGFRLTVVEVKIELKEGVADPEGRNTQKALELLGFSGIKEVRSVKVFEIDLEASEHEAKKQVEEMCKRLLANPVIHKYSVRTK